MSTSSKIMIGLSGILYIIAGMLCIFSVQGTLLSIAWLIGFFTLLSGILSMSFYFSLRGIAVEKGYVLLSGIADIVIGLLFLSHPAAVASAIPYVFAAWIFIAGLLSLIHSFDFRNAGFKNWWTMAFFGILTLIFAVCVFVDPIVGAFAISMLVGIALLTRGFVRFVFLAAVNRIWF